MSEIHFQISKMIILLVTIELLISRIDISTSDNLIINIRNSHFYR